MCIFFVSLPVTFQFTHDAANIFLCSLPVLMSEREFSHALFSPCFCTRCHKTGHSPPTFTNCLIRDPTQIPMLVNPVSPLARNLPLCHSDIYSGWEGSSRPSLQSWPVREDHCKKPKRLNLWLSFIFAIPQLSYTNSCMLLIQQKRGRRMMFRNQRR